MDGWMKKRKRSFLNVEMLNGEMLEAAKVEMSK